MTQIKEVSKTDEAIRAYMNTVFDNKNTLPSSDDNGKFSIGWARQAEIDLSPREYQREMVATYQWKCELIKTLLVNTHYKIPALHVRIFRNEKEARDVVGYEVVDGQQRLSAILDFIGNKFKLPMDFPKVQSKYDVAGKNFKEICASYPSLRNKILDYGLTATFYDNFTDDQVSDLFVNILNNTNDLTAQEKRNAIRSALARYVRNTARFNPHELFSRFTVNKNTKEEKTFWKYFSTSFALGRMEGDEWLAELIYLYLNGMSGGVTTGKLNDFYLHTAVTIGNKNDWNWKTKLSTLNSSNLKKDINSLLNSAVNIIKAVGDEHQHKFNRVFTLFAVLFAEEMKSKYDCTTIDYDKYADKLMATYKKWCDENVYLKDEFDQTRKQHNGKVDMGPFNKLFNGKNSNAFKTAYKIVTDEMENPSDWGFVKLDPKTSFPKHMIERRLNENGGVCDYTGEPLSLSDAVGDHNIPRTWGIALGGVTEYVNLAVTTRYHNQQKLTMSGDQYLDKLDSQREVRKLQKGVLGV